MRATLPVIQISMAFFLYGCSLDTEKSTERTSVDSYSVTETNSVTSIGNSTVQANEFASGAAFSGLLSWRPLLRNGMHELVFDFSENSSTCNTPSGSFKISIDEPNAAMQEATVIMKSGKGSYIVSSAVDMTNNKTRVSLTIPSRACFRTKLIAMPTSSNKPKKVNIVQAVALNAGKKIEIPSIIIETRNIDPKALRNNLQAAVDSCATKAQFGCSVMIVGTGEIKTPVYLRERTLVSGITFGTKLINTSGKIGPSGAVFHLGMLTRWSPSYLLDSQRLSNADGRSLRPIAKGATTINGINGFSFSREDWKPGDKILLVDRVYQGCARDFSESEKQIYCPKGETDWVLYVNENDPLGKSEAGERRKARINTEIGFSINTVKSISADRKRIELEHPLKTNFVNPLVANYSNETFDDPGADNRNPQQHFFARDVTVTNIKVAAAVAPILLQGCLNCLISDIRVGDDNLVPRNMIYGNAYIKSHVTRIKGSFSRHSIEMGFRSQDTVVSSIDATQRVCTEKDCDLRFDSDRKTPGGERECLPMVLGITENGINIKFSDIKIRPEANFNNPYCVSKGLVAYGERHEIKNVHISAQNVQRSIMLLESHGGIKISDVRFSSRPSLAMSQNPDLSRMNKGVIIEDSVNHAVLRGIVLVHEPNVVPITDNRSKSSVISPIVFKSLD